LYANKGKAKFLIFFFRILRHFYKILIITSYSALIKSISIYTTKHSQEHSVYRHFSQLSAFLRLKYYFIFFFCQFFFFHTFCLNSDFKSGLVAPPFHVHFMLSFTFKLSMIEWNNKITSNCASFVLI
jgi:hypothetical protein